MLIQIKASEDSYNITGVGDLIENTVKNISYIPFFKNYHATPQKLSHAMSKSGMDMYSHPP